MANSRLSGQSGRGLRLAKSKPDEIVEYYFANSKGPAMPELTAGQKAALTKKRRKAGAKAALTRKRRQAGMKAALTRKRREAGRKAPQRGCLGRSETKCHKVKPNQLLRSGKFVSP